MSSEQYKMVIECVNFYHAKELEDGSLEIRIDVPARFGNLWKAKLSELTTTDTEIHEYRDIES